MNGQFKTFIAVTMAVSLFLSGCLTPRVWNKGLHPRSAEGKKVYQAQDQSLAVEAQVNGLKGSYTKYFVKEGAALEQNLQNNSPASTDSVRVVDIDVSHFYSRPWKEYPNEETRRDATLDDLPEKFSSDVATHSFSDPIPLNVDGKPEEFRLGQFIGLKKDRDPKSYPRLALLPLAAVADIVIGVVSAPFVIGMIILEGLSGFRKNQQGEKREE